jgi:hypothetical protein
MDDRTTEEPSALDDLREGFETIRGINRTFKGYFVWVMMHVVPVVAAIYGALAWKAPGKPITSSWG